MRATTVARPLAYSSRSRRIPRVALHPSRDASRCKADVPKVSIQSVSATQDDARLRRHGKPTADGLLPDMGIDLGRYRLLVQQPVVREHAVQ